MWNTRCTDCYNADRLVDGRPVEITPLATDTSATENLLEVTDRRAGRSNPSVTSRCGSSLLLLTCALLMPSLFQRLPLFSKNSVENCFHSAGDNPAWATIDLEEETEVTSITITGRSQ